jgi:hypothetical protein
MIRTMLVAGWLLLFSSLASAADSGTMIANTSLHQQPDGGVTGTLLANTLVEIEERRGGWYRVSASGGRQGWVRLASVRLAGQKQSESVFSGLWGWVNSGRSMQSGGTATAGIRGLDAGDIEASKPDYAAVDSLNGYAVDAATANRFAAALPLRTRQIAPAKEGRK